MNHAQGLSNRIDAYLVQLRECLGELPPEEVTDILREIRGHILERAEANGELTEERLVAILKSLGRPEDIAPLYQADAAVARAKISLSPRVVMRGIQRWSRVSAWGLALFVAGVVGYGTGFALILCGIGKIIAPAQFGGWVGHRHTFDIGVEQRSRGPGRPRRLARADRPHRRPRAGPRHDPGPPMDAAFRAAARSPPPPEAQPAASASLLGPLSLSASCSSALCVFATRT